MVATRNMVHINRNPEDGHWGWTLPSQSQKCPSHGCLAIPCCASLVFIQIHGSPVGAANPVPTFWYLMHVSILRQATAFLVVASPTILGPRLLKKQQSQTILATCGADLHGP